MFYLFLIIAAVALSVLAVAILVDRVLPDQPEYQEPVEYGTNMSIISIRNITVEQYTVSADVVLSYENQTLQALNNTENFTEDVDLAILVKKPIYNDEKTVVGWKEDHFTMYHLNLSLGNQSFHFPTLIMVEDGWWHIEFELWDRINIPGASKFYDMAMISVDINQGHQRSWKTVDEFP